MVTFRRGFVSAIDLLPQSHACCYGGGPISQRLSGPSKCVGDWKVSSLAPDRPIPNCLCPISLSRRFPAPQPRSLFELAIKGLTESMTQFRYLADTEQNCRIYPISGKMRACAAGGHCQQTKISNNERSRSKIDAFCFILLRRVIKSIYQNWLLRQFPYLIRGTPGFWL